MIFFVMFVVVKGGLKLFIREGGAQLARSLMYLWNEKIWTFNHVAINGRVGIFLKESSGYIKIYRVIVVVAWEIIYEWWYDIILLAK